MRGRHDNSRYHDLCQAHRNLQIRGDEFANRCDCKSTCGGLPTARKVAGSNSDRWRGLGTGPRRNTSSENLKTSSWSGRLHPRRKLTTFGLAWTCSSRTSGIRVSPMASSKSTSSSSVVGSRIVRPTGRTWYPESRGRGCAKIHLRISVGSGRPGLTVAVPLTQRFQSGGHASVVRLL